MPPPDGDVSTIPLSALSAHLPSWFLHALAQSGRPHDAVRVFDHMHARRGPLPDAHACTAFGRARMVATSRKVFDDMARAGAP
ncbi:hypothetical protein QYE76_049769 [Lolium multiflorum]|uniref:Pentatricopeptide repeat-containing protein n=1 Tax=Lolium multiflorum TaxID=4521 RepID=A0AAD8SPI8_LOLMU|nr:hypothetical protein QYE76_049769 [Lolium multiflorum]